MVKCMNDRIEVKLKIFTIIYFILLGFFAIYFFNKYAEWSQGESVFVSAPFFVIISLRYKSLHLSSATRLIDECIWLNFLLVITSFKQTLHSFYHLSLYVYLELYLHLLI